MSLRSTWAAVAVGVAALCVAFVGIGVSSGWFARGFTLPESHEGVRDALELARRSPQVRELVGELTVERIRIHHRREAAFELEISGYIDIRGPIGPGVLDIDYLRRGDTKNLKVKLHTASAHVEIDG